MYPWRPIVRWDGVRGDCSPCSTKSTLGIWINAEKSLTSFFMKRSHLGWCKFMLMQQNKSKAIDQSKKFNRAKKEAFPSKSGTFLSFFIEQYRDVALRTWKKIQIKIFLWFYLLGGSFNFSRSIVWTLEAVSSLSSDLKSNLAESLETGKYSEPAEMNWHP